ncbi:MAG: hypothetical protein Q7R59_02415 [bacterium]|nr:hypothetical protein [bacterium]
MFRNRTYRDSSGESGLSERELKDYFADRSEKRLDQTQEQFYAEVDKVVQELEMDMVLIQKTINVYIHDREYEDKNPRELIKVLDKFLAPIYVALRKKGYNSQDLVG